MPSADTVSNVSGRNSRASNVSANTGASRSHRSPPPHDSWTNAGVLSMLKTSTDTGDIGALSFNTSRLPTLPRNAHTKRGHIKRPSTSAPPQHNTGVPSNHSYAPSQNSRISSQWDASSTHRRGSLTSMQSNPPSIPPVHLSGKQSLTMMPPNSDTRRDSRSYSMTSAHPGQPLPRHQSATSLKSQGHEPRTGTRMAVGGALPPGMSENRPLFVYPTRLKRPGYRSPSPALSDTYAGHAPPPGAFPMGRGMAVSRGPPPGAYNGHHAGNPMEYAQDPHHLNVRPPPRTSNNSPNNLGFEHSQYNYRAGPPRPIPSLGMPHQMPQPMIHTGPSPMYPPHPQAPRAQYGPQYAGRPGYAPYTHMQHPGQRGPLPNQNVIPMAHQMFHNAARMARHLPHRTDTPMTEDMSPPSSDPPSSGSAPTSSNPPTPKDSTSIRVTVDPAFIDPALMDLPSSSSEPVLPVKYFEYADGPHDEQDIEVLHPSVPPSGFVQRVKAMLESKAMAEAAAESEFEKASHQALIHSHQLMHQYAVDHDHDEVSELQELHEMAANETPRFTVIEEFNAPVELPASPVKVPELEANEVTSVTSTQRITRDMIQAELGPSSTENTQQQVPSADSLASLTARREQQGDLQECPEPSPDDLDYQADYETRRLSPGPVQSTCEAETVVENEIITSADTSIPTGIDYALRFCAPIDTTISVNETQSKDPFALDADTITLQQQQTKEISPKPDDHQDLREPQSPEAKAKPRSKVYSITPISPLRSDEVVKRSSAVSPLHTQTMGIDETLGLGTQDMTMTTDVEEVGETGFCTEDMIPPPTPRTLKTYSKSVQLHTNMDVPNHASNTHRFSLPGDLSTIGDTTMCSASDMVTDVAVRFSLPGTTITVGKPQIIDVSAGSTPVKPRFDFGLPQQQNTEPRKRTSSVTFADEVAPLIFHKKQEPLRLQNISETSSIRAKSIIRKPSPREDLTESSRTTSRDSTTDLRFAGNNMNGTTKGFGSNHLPGLKEESIEDVSLSSRNLSSEIASFPLPARIAAVKAMQERRLQETADKTKARRQARQYNRSLADTKDLPSLNFSRMDLIDKLNQALDLRTTKSMDVVRRRDFSGIHCPSSQRPLSTEPLRDRYTSFFNKPEDFSFFDESEDSEAEDHASDKGRERQNEIAKENVPNTETALVPVLQIQEQTEIEGVEPDKRPLSPEDFLSVATQVNRLSIPSVNGLSERLSELIPGLKNLSSLQIDSVLNHDDDHDVHEVHGRELARPDTVLTNRTSAGFRTLAERAEEIVKNGTHDSIVAAIRALSLNINKELPALPGSASVDMLAGTLTSADMKTAYLSGSVSVPTDLHKDPVRPMSAMLKAKTPTTEDEVRRMLPSGLNPIARNARRSMILSHPTSRPWNLDKNYPWSGDEVEIDLSVPDQAHTRESFTKELLRKRGTKSLDRIQQGEATGTSHGIDIGDLNDTRLDSTASLTLQLTSLTPQHLRIPSKRSIIGSISKKFGLSGRGVNDDDTTIKSLQSRSPIPRASSVDHYSHRAGDRYPTSGLTPPANFHIDEVRSFFSDNSSEHERTASFRKRLTHFKGVKTKTARLGGPRGQSFDVGNTTYEAGSMAEARLGTNSSANTYDGVGMSKTEFHIKRFGEKLRHLFVRGGELIRTISVKSRVRGRLDHNQDEWLADSLYSGV